MYNLHLLLLILPTGPSGILTRGDRLGFSNRGSTVSGACLRKENACRQCSHSTKEINVSFVFVHLSFVTKPKINLRRARLSNGEAARGSQRKTQGVPWASDAMLCLGVGHPPKWFSAITCAIWLRLIFRGRGSAWFFGTHLLFFHARGRILEAGVGFWKPEVDILVRVRFF